MTLAQVYLDSINKSITHSSTHYIASSPQRDRRFEFITNFRVLERETGQTGRTDRSIPDSQLKTHFINQLRHTNTISFRLHK